VQQQNAATAPTSIGPIRPLQASDLHQRPSSTSLPGFLIFTRTSDQEILARLPGAIVRADNDVKFPIDGNHELDAARLVKV
jgi:hypothetical protein